ncbi:MAG: RNA polymerase sigma factor [Myxococcaceae bacterium]
MSVKKTITQVWRSEAASLIGGLARIVRDVGLAEDLAQDAFLIALTTWPRTGIPDNPGGWLMATAKNRALNALKRSRLGEQAAGQLSRELDTHVPLPELEAALEAQVDRDVNDEVLRLMFIACHPVLSQEARVTLTLKLLAGLSNDEIARAFLSTETTIQQRVVRAKNTLREAKIPFEVPQGEELSPRLASVLEAIYLVFNEGYTATKGDDLMRPALCAEAMRLGEILATVAPAEPEVHALLALMRLQSSRAAARVDDAGEPVLLEKQDRSKWDAMSITTGLASLSRAEELSVEARPYRLQARIAAVHARAKTPAQTDWKEIAATYKALARQLPSPVNELNRAVALAKAEGPEAGLKVIDELVRAGELERYHLLHAARAELLEQLGRRDEARAEFEKAASLTENSRQRARLLKRSQGL